LKLDELVYRTFTTEAADFAKSMVFSFEGSKLAGDVVSFFEALKIDPQMRWDVFSSSEYLTLSLLVDDTQNIRYETIIDSASRNENADEEMVSASTDHTHTIYVIGQPRIKDIKDLVHAFQSGNTNYSGQGSKDILNRLVFGYGWVAEGSYFYNSVAGLKEGDAFLAPLRDAFCESCCRIDSQSQVKQTAGTA
jgi:hypothetical protein